MQLERNIVVLRVWTEKDIPELGEHIANRVSTMTGVGRVEVVTPFEPDITFSDLQPHMHADRLTAPLFPPPAAWEDSEAYAYSFTIKRRELGLTPPKAHNHGYAP